MDEQIRRRLHPGYSSVKRHMQEAIDSVSSWAVTNRMVLNAKSTKDMWVSFSTTRIHIGNREIERVDRYKSFITVRACKYL